MSLICDPVEIWKSLYERTMVDTDNDEDTADAIDKEGKVIKLN